MKRFSPIFFIWLTSFILSCIILFMTYKTGTYSEFVAWFTSTLFTGNVLVYHLYVTRNEKPDRFDSDIIDE